MTDTGECALHRAWNPRGKKVNSGAGRNRDDEEFARRIPSPLLRLLSLFSSFLSLFPFPFVACQRTNRREQDGRRYFRFAIFTRGRGWNGAKNHLSRRKVGERILREFFHGSRPTDLALIFRPFRSFPWPRPRLPPPRPRLPPPQRRIFTILRVEKSPFSTRRATPSLRVVAHRSPPPNRPPRFLRVSSRLLLPLLLLSPDSLKSRGDGGISSDPQCVRASPSLP